MLHGREAWADGMSSATPGQLHTALPSLCASSLERWQRVGSLGLIHNEVSNGSGAPGALMKPVMVSQGLCGS